MGLPQRRSEHFTYADYPSWLDDTDCELIDGAIYAWAPDWVAEVLSPASAAHGQIAKPTLHERAGMSLSIGCCTRPIGGGSRRIAWSRAAVAARRSAK